MLKLIECPRDAMQGLKEFVPTELKAKYINKLLRAGFDTIDFGSFVSPKAIPQMRDTAKVLDLLELSNSKSKLLAIVANKRGAYDAAVHQEIDFLGYPFSISETFQMRNTNATIEESMLRIADIQSIAIKNSKKVVLYISMGFGNPYGDEWSVDIVEKWVSDLVAMGIGCFSLSDTVGVSTPESIRYLFQNLIPRFPEVEFGAHLHTRPDDWEEKVNAAYKSGCRRFDGALKGYGGCPMAKDELVGNMPMEKMIQYFNKNKIELGLDQNVLNEALVMTPQIFL
ncbi:MAG: hydroxymethylglutaryl-CoA lyase [Saprospiraceae bacterium]|jgi:hydroxymethylglutaryl-CoA lyase